VQALIAGPSAAARLCRELIGVLEMVQAVCEFILSDMSAADDGVYELCQVVAYRGNTEGS
jgi:hypothetical protein